MCRYRPSIISPQQSFKNVSHEAKKGQIRLIGIMGLESQSSMLFVLSGPKKLDCGPFGPSKGANSAQLDDGSADLHQVHYKTLETPNIPFIIAGHMFPIFAIAHTFSKGSHHFMAIFLPPSSFSSACGPNRSSPLPLPLPRFHHPFIFHRVNCAPNGGGGGRNKKISSSSPILLIHNRPNCLDSRHCRFFAPGLLRHPSVAALTTIAVAISFTVAVSASVVAETRPSLQSLSSCCDGH